MDVLVVSVDSTTGWREGARELAASLERAGASVAVAAADPVPRVRTFMLTDFVQARAARAAALRGIAEHDPRAIVYCSITAALMWPRPGAISLDSIAAFNRPGRHGIWQRQVEQRRLRQAPLVLPWSERALDGLRGPRPETVVVPVPVEPPERLPAARDLIAVTYAGDPEKRRLPLVLDAWRSAHRPGEELIVAGLESAGELEGVRTAGRLDPQAFRDLLVRARIFLAAPEREEYGIAALEALACGCMLVTTPSPGGYPALDIARRLDARLVDEDLARAIRIALDDPVPDYRSRAAQLLEPFSRRAVDLTVKERVLPRLLSP